MANTNKKEIELQIERWTKGRGEVASTTRYRRKSCGGRKSGAERR
jgi:hypothetical protein